MSLHGLEKPDPKSQSGEVQEIRPGRYRHFKGGLYEVIGVAKHVDTGEELVVYRPLYGDRQLAIRPKETFLEYLCVEGQRVQRFAYLASAASS